MDDEVLMVLDDDDDDLIRNAPMARVVDHRSRRRRRRRAPVVIRTMAPAPVQVEPAAAPAAMAPVVSKWTGNLRTGLMIDAAAQILAALTPLPQKPPASSGSASHDYDNLVEYQAALAANAKRNEQVRTLGALAKVFLS